MTKTEMEKLTTQVETLTSDVKRLQIEASALQATIDDQAERIRDKRQIAETWESRSKQNYFRLMKFEEKFGKFFTVFPPNSPAS